MSPLVKAIIAGLPFVIAIAIGMMSLQPAMDELNLKTADLDEKTLKRDDLTTKLASEKKVSAKKMQLEQEINSLRESVPKTPDLDLFNIDLEKMAIESGMDLISIAPPKDAGGSAAASSSKLKVNQDKLKSMVAGNTPPAAAPGAAGAPGGKKEEVAPKSDVEEVSRQVVLTGSYHSLRKMVHKLESYQRVIKISSILEHLPKKPGDSKKVELPDEAEVAEGGEFGDPKSLYVSMNITAYYLP